jgi:NTE family protein
MAGHRMDPSLASVDIFRDLLPIERAALADELEQIRVARGEVLVHQNEVSDALFIVESGRFEVSVAGRGTPIAEIGPGSPVGEIAFLAGGVRTATVTAARDSVVMKLTREQFDRLCARNPAIWPRLTAALARRLADQTAGRSMPVDPIPRVIAVVPAGSRPMPPKFLAHLENAFGRAGSLEVVRSSNLRKVLGGQTDLNSNAAARALNALETRHDFVLLIADGELTLWSEKAIRQADLVLSVGVASTEPRGPVPLSPHEQLASTLFRPESHRLVLVHDRRGRVRGTAQWLANRKVGAHHHVALTDEADSDRLVRFVRGTALGFVACGGGAFCAAHIGLYKAFLERGISFDIMGGTSGGSAMTAAFAMGTPPEEVAAATHEMFVRGKALRRYTWPRFSLLDHTHFDRLLHEHYGGIDIEDLWIPYFAVSTNLSRHAVHRHTRGDLWAAIRSSGSIPGLLPPYYTPDGEMLVDGALLDNVPVRIMHELKRGPNIVVSFEAPRLQRFPVIYQALPSRTQLLWRLINPFQRKTPLEAPGLRYVLMRALMANRHGFEQHLKSSDLLLVPPLPESMSVMDWGRHRELYRSAYEWALAEVDALKAKGHAAFQRAGGGPARPFARVRTRSRKREKV